MAAWQNAPKGRERGGKKQHSQFSGKITELATSAGALCFFSTENWMKSANPWTLNFSLNFYYTYFIYLFIYFLIFFCLQLYLYWFLMCRAWTWRNTNPFRFFILYGENDHNQSIKVYTVAFVSHCQETSGTTEIHSSHFRSNVITTARLQL